TRHPHSGTPHHLSPIRLESPLQEPEQRRLAGAVATEQANSLSVVDLQAHAVEQGRSGEAEVYAVQSEQRHIRTSVPRRVRLVEERTELVPRDCEGAWTCSAGPLAQKGEPTRWNLSETGCGSRSGEPSGRALPAGRSTSRSDSATDPEPWSRTPGSPAFRRAAADAVRGYRTGRAWPRPARPASRTARRVRRTDWA